MTRVYISSRMTGCRFLNFPAFFRVGEALTRRGFEVVNPAQLDGESWRDAWEQVKVDRSLGLYSWERYLLRDVAQVFSVDEVCVFGDWRSSKGAQLEVAAALLTGKPVWEFETGKSIRRLSVSG